MKSVFIKLGFVSLIVAVGLLSGCAGCQHGLVLDPVGPAPVHSASVQSTNGELVVYTAYEVSADFNNRDPRAPEYSDYRIFSGDGKLLHFVHNNSGSIRHDPVTMVLPAGEYQVITHANGYNLVSVPVIIRNNQMTVIHLEGESSWPNGSGLNSTNAVLLPDGQMVGWRATDHSIP